VGEGAEVGWGAEGADDGYSGRHCGVVVVLIVVVWVAEVPRWRE
jgi:hypothetical protein